MVVKAISLDGQRRIPIIPRWSAHTRLLSEKVYVRAQHISSSARPRLLPHRVRRQLLHQRPVDTISNSNSHSYTKCNTDSTACADAKVSSNSQTPTYSPQLSHQHVINCPLTAETQIQFST